MPWTREKLEAEWIGAPIEALGDRAPAALSAFNCVEKHLGAEWLTARHLQGSGPEPTLGPASRSQRKVREQCGRPPALSRARRSSRSCLMRSAITSIA